MMEISKTDLKIMKTINKYSGDNSINIKALSSELDIKEDILEKRISNLANEHLITYDIDVVNGEIMVKGYFLSENGKIFLTDNKTNQVSRFWLEFRTHLLYPMVCSIVTAVIFFFIGLYTGIYLK